MEASFLLVWFKLYKRMDSIISRYSFQSLDELSVCYERGIAYQTDMSTSVPYEVDYFNKYIQYENTEIANQINNFRTSITEKYCKNSILDVGVGSGEFIKKSKRLKVYGYDVNPYGIQWLKEKELFIDPYLSIPEEIEGLSFWDSLEHMKEPSKILLLCNNYVFISIPIIEDLRRIKDSKHYRPNEHYHYFTHDGIISFLDDLDFNLIEESDAEVIAGRQNIYSFVFKKRL